MKNEQITENFMIAAFVCLFGAIVHVANEYMVYRKNHKALAGGSMVALFITAGFSGLVFVFIAMLLSENELHWYLAAATGSFLGVAGLTRVTDAALDIVLAAAGKK